LSDGKGFAANRDFYLASRTFAEQNPEVIKAVRAETQEVAKWAAANPMKWSRFFHPC
jgi:sulfonate transport system substrate-binding protein